MKPESDRAGCALCQAQDGGTAPVAEAATDPRRVVQPDKKALLNRLRRIEGQIAGLAAMLDNDRYCTDILVQISAAKSALDGVAVQILSNHADGCVRRAIHAGGGEAEVAELMDVIRRMMR